MLDLKQDLPWRSACSIAANLGVTHAQLNIKPWNANHLWATVTAQLDPVGPVRACNAHPHYLRNVYGGAYNGVKLSRESARKYAAQAAGGANNSPTPV